MRGKGGRRRRTAALVLVLFAVLTGLAGCGSARFVATAPEHCREVVGPAGQDIPPVEWALPGDTAELRVLHSWCAAVGPAVHVPLRSPSPPSGERPARLDSVAVITWNLHIGGGDLPRLVRDLRSGRLSGGSGIRHFVLLLQEVYRAGDDVPRAGELAEEARTAERGRYAPPSGERRDVVDVARELGLSLLYVPSMRNGIEEPGGIPEDRGNAVLSTLPLSDLRAVELPFEIQRRVAVQVTVRARTEAGVLWHLVAVSAHLDNAALSRPVASFGDLRANQARGLVDALPDGVPLVVGGDFNTWWGQTEEETAQIMREAFPFPTRWQGRATATRLGRDRVLDYLFFRGPPGWRFDDERIGDRYGSDHNPLIGWVVVPSGSPVEPER